MAHRSVLRFASRGWRDIPAPSTRVRGSGRLPYNPDRPLSLPGDRNPRRRPQFRTDALARMVLPALVLGALGVGVFFGVSALLNNDDPPALPAATPAASDAGSGDLATSPAALDATSPGTAAPTDSSLTATPAAASADAATDAATPINADQSVAESSAAVETPVETPAEAEFSVVTEAALGSAPALIERGGATPIPSGLAGLTLADGTLYDPADSSAAISSVWPAGTVLELTRLPGGPLLTDEDAAELIGKTIQVLVVGNGEFPTELQLSPAAYELFARDFEPIIAVRITAVSAPE